MKKNMVDLKTSIFMYKFINFKNIFPDLLLTPFKCI